MSQYVPLISLSALTNMFTALKFLHSETPTGENAYLVGDSIVRPLQETWKGCGKNGNDKSRKVLCRPGAGINITRQVRNLRCQKKSLIVTHVAPNNLQKTGNKKLMDDI